MTVAAFTVWVCRQADPFVLVIDNETEANRHMEMGHPVIKLDLKERRRRGTTGYDTQWSTDWMPERT